MKATLTNGQLAAMLHDLLTNPESGQVEHVDTFQFFMKDICEVVTNYCGGEMVGVVEPTDQAIENLHTDFPGLYAIEVETKENSIFCTFSEHGTTKG